MKSQNTLQAPILYLKASINYTEFYFEDGRKNISSYTLKYHQNSEKTKNFLRVNNSILINPEYISGLRKEKSIWIVKLINGIEILASRRKGKVLEELNNVFMNSQNRTSK